MLKKLNRLIKNYKDMQKRATSKEDKLYFSGVVGGIRRAKFEYLRFKKGLIS